MTAKADRQAALVGLSISAWASRLSRSRKMHTKTLRSGVPVNYMDTGKNWT